MKNKRVLVVGMGKSGIAATQALLKLGADVSVQDSKDVYRIEPQLISFLEGQNVKFYFGEMPEDMSVFDMLVLSPGVPKDLPFIKEAEKKGCEIVGELEIAYRVGHGRYVAITGTNGKTTTTTLVGEIFKANKRKTYVVGNIGVAVISMALSATDDAWLVTEVSSFQLETIKSFKPEISAILNLTPDHLDRHKTMEKYGFTKARIFENQDASQYTVVNYDDKECLALAQKSKAKIVPFSRLEMLEFGAFLKNGIIVIKDENGKLIEICPADKLQIPGAHNVENALAAAAIAYFSGIGAETIAEALCGFMGVEHRLEYVDTIDGVVFINDSKGTNPDSSIKAVEAIKGNIILIAGGYEKNAQYDEFIESFKGKVKNMVLMGKTAEKIKAAAQAQNFTNSTICNNMEECVRLAFELAEAGDTVLLSPACASWDMYSCFEQRGEHFKNCVYKL